MANKKVPKKARKGYFSGLRWAFNGEVRSTLVAWMRKLRARVWVVAPLVALALGVDKRPEMVAAIVTAVVLISAIVQLLVASATEEPDKDPAADPDPPARSLPEKEPTQLPDAGVDRGCKTPQKE